MLIILCVFVMTGALSALDLSLGVHGGAFFQRDENFKEIYGNGFQLGIEARAPIWKVFSLHVGAGYRATSGAMTFSGEATRLKIYPVEAGVRARVSFGRFSPYIGGGIGLFFFRESNPIGTISDSGLGYIGEAGCLVRIASKLSLDLRLRYDHCTVDPAGLPADIGGILALAGLCYDF